ncbi:HAD family hydrolase [Sporosarcina sp. 179-K 8C2 HS]|uniref:HAD family hydrolase n=1 Tax=Sporosarcina sp. 179-K 8C2 HS TaxID=3142387 RepID=UPI0039A31AA5
MKAIIFDFDGTLANTLPICDYAFQSVFKEFDNKDLSSGEIRAMFGPCEVGIINGNLLHANKEQAIELYYEKYLEKHNDLVAANQEIHDLLIELKRKGLKLAIVTGKAKRSLDISMKALQMHNYFDVIITGDDVVQPKPHPEGLLKALSQLHVEPHEAMYVGDSDADIQAGMGAGIYTVGVHWLPDIQTMEFSVGPHALYKEVHEFINSLSVSLS